MTEVIPFTPRRSSPSGLLRGARERTGLDHREFAALLGPAIGRPELGPGTLRAWESDVVTPPPQVLDAAQHVVSTHHNTQPAAAPANSPPASPIAGSFTLAAGRPDVAAVMQAFRDADRQVGGGYVYGAVVRYLEQQIAPGLFRGSSDLFAAAAALTEMAGWMAHDAGHDTLANEHFHHALRFAAVTDDTELAAHVHASLSHHAQHLNRPRDALQFAQAGRAALRQRPHHPALAARLHAMEARALASLGRRADMAQALMLAETALDETPSEPPSPWVSPFDHASLAAEASQSTHQLRQLAAARRHSEQVITLRASTHVRSRAFGHLRLATILVSQGEIEHACTVTETALASSDRLASTRVMQLLEALHTQLRPHTRAAGVDSVLHSLSTALHARAHTRILIAAAENPTL